MKHRHILFAPLILLPLMRDAFAGVATAITANVTVDTRTGESVTVPDPALLAALRAALAKPNGDITTADLLTLTTLRIAGLGIANLAGLEKATNLRILDIRRNSFSDATALWAVLDQITPMYCLYVDVRRPGADPAGRVVQTLTDTSGNEFFILVDAPNLPSLDFNSLDISASNASNLQALRVIADAGVEVDTGGRNLPPYANANASVSNAATRTVILNASAGDVDGRIASHAWSWPGGSAEGTAASVTLPYGTTEIALTVTDDDGATATAVTTVSLVPDATVDSDGDGLTDLVEFAFHLDTERPDHRVLTEGTGTTGLPSVSLDTSGSTPRLRIEFLRRKDAANLGISYQPQWSSNLAIWSSAVSDTRILPVNDVWERVIVMDPSPGTSRFGRVSVSTN